MMSVSAKKVLHSHGRIEKTAFELFHGEEYKESK
jgi:hypothetical protein